MKRFRNTVGILLIWFFLFYNIERINEPINLASFVYVYVLICSLVMLFFHPVLSIHFFWLFLFSLPPYFMLKEWFYHNLAGRNLPLTVTEVVAIGLTIYLSRQVARQLNEIGEAVISTIINPLRKDIYPFESSQSDIYREIRRARQHQHDVSLLAASVCEPSFHLNRNRFIRELENEIIQRYINARVGKIFVDRLHITDIVAQRDNHFIILLPHTGKEDTSKIVHRLQSNVRERLGINLNIGAATFPAEATTFEKLLETAEEKMCQSATEEEKLPAIQETDAGTSIEL
jgi:hypothetical protein